MNQPILFFAAIDDQRERICPHGKVVPMPDHRKQADEEMTAFCQGFWTVVGVGLALYCIGFAYVIHKLGWWR